MTGTGLLWRTTHCTLRSVTAEIWPVCFDGITLCPSPGLKEFVRVYSVILRGRAKRTQRTLFIYIETWDLPFSLTSLQHFCEANAPPWVTNITCCGVPTHPMCFSAVQGLFWLHFYKVAFSTSTSSPVSLMLQVGHSQHEHEKSSTGRFREILNEG